VPSLSARNHSCVSAYLRPVGTFIALLSAKSRL
jgi:hypothetical protein